jgi:ABC-type taurine transport system ATPase subunit
LTHKLEDLELIELPARVLVAVTRYSEQTLEVLLAEGHRPVLRVTHGGRQAAVLLLREVLVIEAHEGDIVGADVEEHQFILEESVFREFTRKVED